MTSIEGRATAGALRDRPHLDARTRTRTARDDATDRVTYPFVAKGSLGIRRLLNDYFG